MRFDEVAEVVDGLSARDVLRAWREERANALSVVGTTLGVLRLPIPRKRVARFLKSRMVKIYGKETVGW